VTALACGIIAVGSCNGDVTSTIVQTIMEKSELELKDTYARWLPLGLGLNHLGMFNGKGDGCLGIGLVILKHISVHLDECNITKISVVNWIFPIGRPPGKGEAIETTLAALQVVPEPFRSFANTLVDICAYAGLSELLHMRFINAIPYLCFNMVGML